VTGGGGGREAVAERGRPGVLPWLASYAPTSITVEAPDAPPGSEPGDYLRTLTPGYMSGVAVRVGTQATIYAEGYLLTGEGKAVPFLPGEARPDGDPQAGPIGFFTDENGQFQIYGLAPGSWEIRFGGDEPFTAMFFLPPDAQGLHDVGSFRLPILQRKGQ
jgi:outer membrane usher protein